jgi:Family of unknown function (DUF5985)
MAELAYSLCTLTALVCCLLLLRGFSRSGNRLLLWGGLCFAGLTLNNLLLAIDKIVVPEIDHFLYRLILALVAMLVLLFGLIWDWQ